MFFEFTNILWIHKCFQNLNTFFFSNSCFQNHEHFSMCELFFKSRTCFWIQKYFGTYPRIFLKKKKIRKKGSIAHGAQKRVHERKGRALARSRRLAPQIGGPKITRVPICRRRRQIVETISYGDLAKVTPPQLLTSGKLGLFPFFVD